MERARIRLSLWRLMALVVITAIVLGLGVEIFVILPRERPRLEHAATHWRTAEGRLRQANSPYNRLTPKLRQDILDSSAWHRRKWDELRKDSSFDPKQEEQIDLDRHKLDELIDWEFYQQNRSW